MDIEVLTTKKRLTKALINQMPNASLNVFQYLFTGQVEILGFVTGVSKTQEKLALLKFNGGYYKFDVSHYTKVTGRNWAETDVKLGCSIEKFGNEDATNHWIKSANHIVRVCLSREMHIYI